MSTSHPRIDASNQLRTPPASAAALGYRMPAEWEPQACVWITWPHNAETWPGCMDLAAAQFQAWIDAMRAYVPVSSTQELGIPTNDSWIRDFGPIFVVRDNPEPKAQDSGLPEGQAVDALPPLACHDFHFNGWGGKYEVRDLDDQVPQHIARALGVPVWVHDFVLEGGSIDVNGRGTVMTTQQCLLNPNRNPGMTRQQIEAKLHETLGTRHVIWLPGGIAGDDTDGHIDDVARFVSPDTVVIASAPPGHPDHEALARNRAALEAARDQDGRRLTVVDLPMPEPINYNYPPDRFGPGGPSPLPASYANFLITNGAVFVPVFNQKRDDEALRVLGQVMPSRTVVPVRCDALVVGLGGVHCLSQQQPADGT